MNVTLLEEFQQRAEAAEKKLAELQARIARLEKGENRQQNGFHEDEKRELSSSSSSSKHILGLPSTMNDDYQLIIRKLMDRGPMVQPNSEVITMISGGYHKMTWKDVQLRGIKLASALSKIGIKIGDRVGTFMWNNGRHMLLYYGVPAMGAVLHTLNIRLSPNELKYIITHAQDKVLFADATLLPLFEKIPIEAFESVERIVICGPNEAPGNWKSSKLPADKLIDFDELLSKGDDNYEWPDLDDRSAMSLCYTSGTTGNPKGVLYSHRSTYIHALTMMTTDTMTLSGKDSLLPYVPMFHALAWATPFSAMCLGCRYLLYNCYRSPEQILKNMIDNECTLFAGVPSVIQGIQQLMATDTEGKYEALRGVLTRAVCGGSAPPPSLIKWLWDEWKIEVVHGWGMTEMNPVGTIARRCVRRRDLKASDEELHRNQCLQGQWIPTCTGKIVSNDDFSKDIAWNMEDMGELLCIGPSVTSSYYKIDASHKFDNGWLITGDIASFDDTGRLQIRDRSKDLIKSAGEWISSVAIENCVMGMDNVSLACVVGVYHPKFGERPVVVAQLKDKEKGLTLDSVKEHLLKTGNFAKWQLPNDVMIVDNIPLGATGKMNKRGVRADLDKDKYVLPELHDFACTRCLFCVKKSVQNDAISVHFSSHV